MIAHSILNTTTNDLSGGLIVRASVLYSGDNLNDNDVLEQAVPIAIMKDKFDGTTLAAETPTFISGRYPQVVAMQQVLEVGKPTLEVQKERTTGVIQTQVVITHRAHTTVSFTCSSLQVVNVEHRGNSTQV